MKILKTSRVVRSADPAAASTRTRTRVIHTATDIERALADFAAEAAVYQVREAVRLGHVVTLAIAQHRDYTTITITSPATAADLASHGAHAAGHAVEDTAIVGHIAPRIAPHGGLSA